MLIRTMCRTCLGSGTRLAVLAHLTLPPDPHPPTTAAPDAPPSPGPPHRPATPGPHQSPRPHYQGDQALAAHPCPDCDGSGHHLQNAATHPRRTGNGI